MSGLNILGTFLRNNGNKYGYTKIKQYSQVRYNMENTVQKKLVLEAGEKEKEKEIEIEKEKEPFKYNLL